MPIELNNAGTLIFKRKDSDEVLFQSNISEFKSDAKFESTQLNRECSFSIPIESIDGSLNNILYPKEPTYSLQVTGKCEILVQKKKHRQKRINKKWLKKYGYITKKMPFECTFSKCTFNEDGEIKILNATE